MLLINSILSSSKGKFVYIDYDSENSKDIHYIADVDSQHILTYVYYEMLDTDGSMTVARMEEIHKIKNINKISFVDNPPETIELMAAYADQNKIDDSSFVQPKTKSKRRSKVNESK